PRCLDRFGDASRASGASPRVARPAHRRGVRQHGPRRPRQHHLTATPIPPGATIGILGGGQLGRMTAMAARSLGYHVHALDPDPSCASRYVVERCITAPFDDVQAAVELAKSCQVVTIEIEKISIAALEAAGKYAPVRP